MLLTGCSSKIIWSSSDRHVSNISHGDEHVADSVEICAGLIVRGVEPLDRFRQTPTWDANVHARWATRRACHIVVFQPQIVHPAVDHKWHQQFQVQPDVKVISRSLGTDVMHHRGLVQPGL